MNHNDETPKWLHAERDGLRGPAIHLHSLLAQAWAEGAAMACAVGEAAFERNPYRVGEA